MNQSTITAEVNNGICEAVGCFKKATVQIEVSAGNKGTISLSVCNECVRKFRDEQ